MQIKIAILAAAALTLAVPAVAHADDTRLTFSSPSGDIHCVINAYQAPTSVNCQLAKVDFTVPPDAGRNDDGTPCAHGEGSGRDFRLVAGSPSFVRCSYAALDGGVGPWPTLAYGKSLSLGSITCDSISDAMRCTDSGSGYFFRISRDKYFVG
jgi:hypothetical protein